MISPYHVQSSPLRTAKIFILGGFILIFYMLYALTVEIYKNYQIDQHIENFEKENQALELQNVQNVEDLQYYTSDAYIEKMAKQNFGLMNPGEKVIILTQGAQQNGQQNTDISGNPSEIQYLSNPKKWWRFFFIDNPFK